MWTPAIIQSTLVVSMSLRRYFKQKSNLPTSSQTQLPTNVLRELNQAVTTASGCEEKSEAREPVLLLSSLIPISSFSPKKGVHVCLYIWCLWTTLSKMKDSGVAPCQSCHFLNYTIKTSPTVTNHRRGWWSWIEWVLIMRLTWHFYLTCQVCSWRSKWFMNVISQTLIDWFPYGKGILTHHPSSQKLNLEECNWKTLL